MLVGHDVRKTWERDTLEKIRIGSGSRQNMYYQARFIEVLARSW